MAKQSHDQGVKKRKANARARQLANDVSKTHQRSNKDKD